jgi:GT2 family glycosyltransferase/glycosyltransferase involved in cell wall biosynthesis
VSIVIPVYNKWAYTAACLRSLVETTCTTGFEVIVVDDQSSDETAERLAGIDGLVYLHNAQNLGFVGSCNRGAEQARGRYIVMLNNDTQVLDGWLDALLETFEQHPDTGLAGARLLYPDGTLQEAGGIVFRDGSGWNYGKGDDPDRPEYRYSREVDYCSGACIMLPTALFRELGGFDSHYAPAYYEDTDLAFRVRARGLQVRLQAAATIIHHEGVTSGTDLGSGAKQFQSINHKKFLQRWRAELTQHPAPVVDPDDRGEIRRARDHKLKGRVLVIDAYTPEPDQDSGSLRLRYLMDCFRDLGYGVTFMPDNRAHAGRYTMDLQAAGVEVLYDPWIESLQRVFAERGGEFDFIMISRHYVASRYVPLLKRHCPEARFIFDTVDLHYLREERLAKLEKSPALERTAAQTRRSELAVIEAADATLVVSPVEQSVLREAAPEARVHVISNVHEVVGCRRPYAERKDIFFVGGYQHPPNIDAAEWFVGSIWPLIREQLPDIQFHLIGSKAPEQVRALHGNGVLFHGFVESLEPWLDGCRLAVAPLRYGAGIKGKVNISMSRGQPVVATPMAVEGMFAKAGRDVLVAETAGEFAAAVVRLYRDETLWNQVSAYGLENVRQYFSVETARLGLQELLNSLA